MLIVQLTAKELMRAFNATGKSHSNFLCLNRLGFGASDDKN